MKKSWENQNNQHH